ncbi:MAG: helix-turn-helix domain-containing protein, partial [Gammaproteobacteria bacterium]
VERFEASVIRDALRASGGSVKQALEVLKIPRKTFYDKITRHGITLDEFRG